MKNSIKFCFALVAMLSVTRVAFSQNTLSSYDDLGRLELTSYVSDQIEYLPVVARNNLQSKLARAVNQYGLGGSTSNGRFIITPNVSVLSKNVIASAPASIAVVLDIGLFVGDGVSGTKFSSGSITAKGVGRTEAKAYINAFKQISPENKEFKRIIEQAKPKILEYYNTRCDFILNEAKVAAAQNKFDLALLHLTTIPEVSKDCYTQASALIPELYNQKIDNECLQKVNEARNAWSTDPSSAGAAVAGKILASINPNASCYKDAVKLSKEIGNRMYELTDRKWDYILKQQELNAEVQKASLETTRELMNAYFSNQPQTIMYNVHGWW